MEEGQSFVSVVLFIYIAIQTRKKINKFKHSSTKDKLFIIGCGRALVFILQIVSENKN